MWDSMQGPNEHVAQHLFALIRGDIPLPDLHDIAFIAEHLNSCVACTMLFDRLSASVDTPNFTALQAHVAGDPMIPTDDELVEIAINDRDLSPDRRNQIVAHVRPCHYCRERLEDVALAIDVNIDELLKNAVIASSETIEPTSPVAISIPTHWQETFTHTLRLVAAYTIGVRSLGIHLDHEELASTIAAGRGIELSLLLGEAPTVFAREQRFTLPLLDLPDEHAQLTLAATWRAFHDKRLSFSIRTQRISLENEHPPGMPIPDVNWRLIPATRETEQPLTSGTTDANGSSDGYIDVEQFGPVILVCTYQAWSWEIPLLLVDEVVSQTARANELVDRHRIAEALATYDAAIAIDASHAPAHAGKGRALLALGHVDEAVRAYEHAIGLDPENAVTWLELGTMYTDIGTSEQALSAFQEAAKLLSADRSVSPTIWAAIQFNLGQCYHLRARGERARNIEEALTAFQNALQVYTRDDYPEQWATIHNQLGLVYEERLTGTRRENLEEAIRHFQMALEVRSRETSPHEYAAVQNNLGSAYQQRIGGEREQNLDAAITSYTAALAILTPEAMPEEYGLVKRNYENARSEQQQARWRDAKRPRDIFVSYAHADSHVIMPFIEEFRRRNLSVWYDRGGYLGGESWVDRIRQQLDRAEILIVILSPAAVASRWVENEVTYFMQSHQGHASQPVVVIQLQSTPLPPWLAESTVINIADSPLTDGIDAVVQQIERRLYAEGVHSSEPDPSEVVLPPRLQRLGFRHVTLVSTEVIIPPTVFVSARTEYRTRPDDHGSDDDTELMQTTRSPDPFAIGVYPVTVAEYAYAIRAGLAAPEDWDTQRTKPDYPVVHLSWHDAFAYTAWLSSITNQQWRLPTELEWKLAAGIPTWSIYRWSARYREEIEWSRGTGTVRQPIGISPGISDIGCHDMGGNIWEWTSSRFVDTTFVGSGPLILPKDQPRRAAMDQRIVLGSPYPINMRNIPTHLVANPTDHRADVGFRLALG